MKTQESHISDAELAGLYTANNQIALLKHITNCPFCSERLAKNISVQNMLHAPHYLKQKILTKKQYERQKKREFTSYCIRICLAVAASLAIIFLSDTTKNLSVLEIREEKTILHHNNTIESNTIKPKKNLPQEIYRGTDFINKKIMDFTENLIHIT